ncbi:MAG: hypothetical protein RMJ35_08845 [Phycisphaerales bacterium]|nr:hypothetical protein [Phycisphaerales bacterium]
MIRVLLLRIRQAEVALADGRLEEAAEIAGLPEVRAHRRGQDLISAVAQSLLERARRWLAMDRPAEAVIDADNAIRLAGNLPTAIELKARAAEVMLQQQNRRRRSAQVLARARLALHQGRLASARDIVQRGELSSTGLATIMEDLNDHQDRLATCLARAQEALARQQYDPAIDQLLVAGRLDASNPQLTALLDQLHGELLGQIRQAIDQGRLDVAGMLEDRLVRIARGAMDFEQIRQHLRELRQAWEAIERGQPRRAEEVLRRLAAALPEARWIDPCIQQLQQAATALEAVRASPISLLAGARPALASETLAPPVPATTPAAREALPTPVPPWRRSATPAGNRLLLQVDGAGSFVLVRDPVISIGPISSSGRVHIGLICDTSTPTCTIERVEDDYFLRAGGGVMVNDRPLGPPAPPVGRGRHLTDEPAAAARGRLLAGGDRIALSPRCRMVFGLPVPASTTAVVDLTGARYPRSDVRRVLLMDRDVVIGPGGATHIRLDSLPEPIVLLQRQAELFLRGGTGLTMGDEPIDENRPLQSGLPIRGSGFGMVITPI